MKLKLVFLLIALVSVGFVFFAWNYSVESRIHLVQEVLIDRGDYSLRLETSKLSYQVGERVAVRLFQKNDINESIQGGGFEIFMQVTYDNGSEVMWTLDSPNWRSDFKINAGEERELDLNLGWSQTDAYGHQVPPGIYTLAYRFGETGGFSELRVRIES